ncbi:MAG: V-type ATP synthase subunit A [Candidatus Abyssubacteria bacterium]|nr:V-type ATP synthase subunit A [Candidatus Abyssubacteria bacterium]
MNEGTKGTIIRVSGPLVVAEGMTDAKMYDLVRVSEANLLGEIIELRGDRASIQVYEDTQGLGPGEPVVSTGVPLSVELGPGMIESIYDGVQRPLDRIVELAGNLITRGIDVPGLDREKKWEFNPTAKAGDSVVGGDTIGTVQETTLVEHRIMAPPGLKGEITRIESGRFTVTDVIAELRDGETTHQLTLMQKWPVRKPRPYKEKLIPVIPLITGQRVIDALFPIGKGGTACVPGPFGAGKTVVQHQLAKWADAQIVIFVGCGERGNEMTDVLLEFPELKDPLSGEPLMKRTILVANTSNMPVAAREASMYTGITMAEYFRDMGYSVAIMADSTSRWAEALREMSGRLEEMPGEEGYPAYLPSRIAEYYERAGRVICLGSDDRIGAVSAIGAVSPPGGDLSDPVVQATLKVVKVFWSLEDKLAYERHFPAINWLTSYSLYHDNLREFFERDVAADWTDLRTETMALLQKEAELKEIARLVGLDALSPDDRLVLETTRSIREDFLHQNAFHDVDSYASFSKQYKMLSIIMRFHHAAAEALERDISIDEITILPIREEIGRMRYIGEEDLDKLDDLGTRAEKSVKALAEQSGEEG